MLSIFASYKTPVVLVIYIIKSDKSLAVDRGKNKSTYFVIWDIDILVNQIVTTTVILFVAMT